MFLSIQGSSTPLLKIKLLKKLTSFPVKIWAIGMSMELGNDLFPATQRFLICKHNESLTRIRNFPSNHPFPSVLQRAPGTGELVIIAVDATKSFTQLGVISADGKRLLHKVDLKIKSYNVMLDFPLTIDINRLIRGGPLLKYDKTEYPRIGFMPRYGGSESILWFDVETCCTLHIINCFEDGDEVSNIKQHLGFGFLLLGCYL
ncbi:carotenoid 9,10(9',10')-cleavage dioxygenase-like [Hevea brasiliensis]|uniref:carotenoid 9,10(9',10')-cleavage dioxygenase-like n=1 Tax=Hevea brasiliensis TaxID=3981 RepID=UPI0025FBDFF1|nr:carotenoid 9,10(9',10')-cleavage dioxygenase-like [Hevea brasiliensis]